MEYTQEMNLLSESGYSMPFNGKNEEVTLLKNYGPQEDGSFNRGIDLAADRYVLRAVADGIVTAIGTNKEYGLYQVTKYGNYEVTYGHITNAMVTFGKKVKAGSIVAISGKTLHLEVKYDGQELNPIDFLTMLFGNVKMHEATHGGSGLPEFDTLEMDIPTDYDESREEIEELMSRFYVDYLSSVAKGAYCVPDHTEQSLRNIFSQASVRNCFYETLPSMTNPMGVADRAMPLAAKVQNLLIADFLNYLALRHQIFLSTMDAASKKKDMTKPSPQPASSTL
jgi:hypothetical protein